ncbi:hypothetical protein Pmani_005131 [Petrolisthes manimaculis]|uniref:Uncharacterized protein n=1 Tax=Petrolisthes manimaculis TaxID=1843537 RepID=A0AAE1UKX9_9EUCA|nr:hypothetical protein Pmani_005131 [Petrolisthes manimaculis]
MVSHIKTKHRSRLKTATLNGLLEIGLGPFARPPRVLLLLSPFVHWVFSGRSLFPRLFRSRVPVPSPRGFPPVSPLLVPGSSSRDRVWGARRSFLRRGTPSFASSPSAHKSRESPKRDSKERKDRREKRKRRDRDTSSSPTPRRRKSRSSTPRVSREEASSLSSHFKDLVNSLPDMFNKLLEARFPHNFPPSVSSFNQSGTHTLPEIDPGLLDSQPASPDPTLPSALEQNQASAPDHQPLNTLAPATATTAVNTPAPAQASHIDRTSRYLLPRPPLQRGDPPVPPGNLDSHPQILAPLFPGWENQSLGS